VPREALTRLPSVLVATMNPIVIGLCRSDPV